MCALEYADATGVVVCQASIDPVDRTPQRLRAAEALVKFIENQVKLAKEHDLRMKSLTDKEFGDYATMHAIHEGGETSNRNQLKKEFAEFLVASGRAAQAALMLDFHLGELENGQVDVAKYLSLLEYTSRLRDELQRFLDALFCGEFGSPKEQQLELALAGAYGELENFSSVKDNWEGAFEQLGKGAEASAESTDGGKPPCFLPRTCSRTLVDCVVRLPHHHADRWKGGRSNPITTAVGARCSRFMLTCARTLPMTSQRIQRPSLRQHTS